MTVEQQRRLEMFIAVLGCPVAAAGAWTLGLRLAAAGLGAVWLVLVVLYVIDHVRHANDTTASALPAAPPLSAPAVVDPARALLDALGDDLTGGTLVIERIVDKLVPGTIVSQGDNAHIDARQYHLTITVEDRARILAEVGQALRPVLEAMSDRIAFLEADNRSLRDTIASLAGAVPDALDPVPADGQYALAALLEDEP